MASEMQKDLVLNPNEYAYVLDKTKGIVNCYVGPNKTSLSNTDAPVTFNSETKKFEECYLEDAIQLFVTAPENWYCILKNPEPNGAHPTPRSVNELPILNIGKKVNITGPASFALFPGQMARVIQGHRLRSNQYLLVRVYDEDSARQNWNKSVIKTNNQSEDNGSPDDETLISSVADVKSQDLTVGKLMVIKGTEVSFYIPPTGIEVVPAARNEYVREAVTLERLEYCILKDENGNKRYVHGPAVVFPEPTESFLSSGNTSNGYKFRAIELSKISGIYIKVIAEYDEDDIHHDVGEEMFITGAQQMIYYPRPEHAIITYDGQVLHHAIAIPAGEGRYVLNRMTGVISMERGPAMFLPDPRTQVIVKRKLSASQASLWYPGNAEVADYNESLADEDTDSLMLSASLNSKRSIMACDSMEPGSFLNRGTKYTKPRTITIDNKFDGVVSIDVWTGYAINVISKDGTRKVIVGPQTYLMGYDETLEILEMSTGKPKTTDNLIRTTFLRVDNNKIGDIINVETKDFVHAAVKVSYTVDFLDEYKDKWFSFENYVKYLCDRIRSLLKREAKKYTIEEFYQNYSDITRKITLNRPEEGDENDGIDGRLFRENGMIIHDVDVLSIDVDRHVAAVLEEHQYDMIKKTIELSDASQRKEVAQRLAEADKAISDIQHASNIYKIKIKTDAFMKQEEYERKVAAAEAAEAMTELENEKAKQALIDEIAAAKAARKEKKRNAKVSHRQKLIALEKERQESYATAAETILQAISPQLAASIESLKDHALFADIAKQISPLTIVNGESIADTANKLLKGTALDGIFKAFTALPEKALKLDKDDE